MLKLLLNCISDFEAPQILSLRDEYTFRFSNFLITFFCNSLANCWVSEITTELIVVPLCVVKDFLSKNLETIQARLPWYPFEFTFLAIFKSLSYSTL